MIMSALLLAAAVLAPWQNYAAMTCTSKFEGELDAYVEDYDAVAKPRTITLDFEQSQAFGDSKYKVTFSSISVDDEGIAQINLPDRTEIYINPGYPVTGTVVLGNNFLLVDCDGVPRTK